jgi:hypothetical protein
MPARTLILSLAVAVLGAAPAVAETAIPNLDPMAMCKRNAAAIQQGDWLVKACLDQEQEAYDALKARWDTLDEKTRKVCIRNSTAIQQGYWLMHACVEQEIEAKAAVDGFEFKR